MNYYLDTNTCIYFMKGAYESVREKLLEHRPCDIKIPAIVKAELLYGARKSNAPEKNIRSFGSFLLPYDIVEFGDAAAVVYSHIRSDLEKAGAPIGPNDLMIAAIVLAEKGTLVTNNVKEFARIPELKTENWVLDEAGKKKR